MSVSDDVSDELGGGTLQLWRVNDLIYRDEAEVLAELDKHRQVVLAIKSLFGLHEQSTDLHDATQICVSCVHAVHAL